MRRLLLLRATEEESLEPGQGVDVLVTHDIKRVPSGVAAFLAVGPEGVTLAVTSKTTVRLLSQVAPGSLNRGWESVLSAGEETARELRAAGVPTVEVPARPGAAGIVEALVSRLAGLHVVWPHGSDADPLPFRSLADRGARLTDLVVYQKTPRAALDSEVLKGVAAGVYGAVAVTSLAALDVFLPALGAMELPASRLVWGAIGPATARAFASRGLPEPKVPSPSTIPGLITLLRET